MCGRYTLASADDYQDLADILEEVEKNLAASQTIPAGEVYPSAAAPVLLQKGQTIVPKLFVWGYPNPMRSGAIINARAETAAARPMFRESVQYMRCVIPSTGFFEWDKATKTKYRFNLPDTGVLYMAGLYRQFEGQSRFVVLTTAANASISDIHDRMPVVLRREQLDDWLTDTHKAGQLLSASPPLLTREAG